MAWNRDLHDWEQDQWNGIEPVLKPAMGSVIDVEDDGTNEVGDEREDKKIANETLLLIHVVLSSLCQVSDVLQADSQRNSMTISSSRPYIVQSFKNLFVSELLLKGES